MLKEVATQLDAWIVQQNQQLRAEGLPGYAPCTIKIIGQTALMEAAVELTLASTMDVDVRGELEFPIRQQLELLLSAVGRSLDPVAHEAWMPRETKFQALYSGTFVNVFIADPESVLLSKALKAPEKNRALLTEYLAKGASERFLRLATKYKLDVEEFL